MLYSEVFDHPVRNIELIETHISWVILTGDFAYKIKKPVNFGFLDFSTLAKRHTCCLNELRLNRRLAPSIYLDVVAISGTQEKPIINSEGEIFEYAVKMVQFPQSAQLDNMLAAGKLNVDHMDAIARMVAEFHHNIDIANETVDYGSNDIIYQPVAENIEQVREHLDITPYANMLSVLQTWNLSIIEKLKPVFEQRKGDGFIRECHGDMHLRNLIWLDMNYHSGPVAFDCIEFNPYLRWIDVISEVAFLVMDLQDRQQHQLANRFLNAYLEVTGDYAGLRVLPFYLCYRALVRAKVAALRLDQRDIPEESRQQLLAEFESYLDLGILYTQKSTPQLIIMHGMSASGKSTVSQQLTDSSGMIRIRSDVERKRLFSDSLDASKLTDNTHTEINASIYSAQSSQQTYKKLAKLASHVIIAGYSVIVDAAFLKYEQRKSFQQLAEQLNVPFIILETTAPAELLRQRIVQRSDDISDADLVVLEYQMSNWQPLQVDEKNNTVSVNTAEKHKISSIVEQIKLRS